MVLDIFIISFVSESRINDDLLEVSDFRLFLLWFRIFKVWRLCILKVILWFFVDKLLRIVLINFFLRFKFIWKKLKVFLFVE